MGGYLCHERRLWLRHITRIEVLYLRVHREGYRRKLHLLGHSKHVATVAFTSQPVISLEQGLVVSHFPDAAPK